MIVVDSNILASLYLPGDFTAAGAFLEKQSKWAAPVLWRSEFRNILAGYLRRKTITFERAHSIQSEAMNLVSGAEFEVGALAALELVGDSDCSAYDCEFTALAMQLKCKLVTMDGKLLRAFAMHAVCLAHADQALACQVSLACHLIQRANHRPPAFIQNMRVDHRRRNVRMSQQFLHSANVVTSL